MEYNDHYDLQDALSKESAIIPSPKLYNLDDEQIYAAMMDRLAQPLPDGTPSPFTARNPGTAESILMGTIVYLQSLLGHEINLVPDRAWVHLMRLHGIEFLQPEYPVIWLTFRRSEYALEQTFQVEIPAGTEVRSNRDPSLSAITLFSTSFEAGKQELSIPARLNRLGVFQVKPNEFVNFPQMVSFVDSVTNSGDVVSLGRNAETLPEAMLRARDETKIQRRLVTARDYDFWAKRLGADKVNVVPKLQPDTEGTFNDVVTVAIYPAAKTDLIRAEMLQMKMADTRMVVTPARLILLTGTVTVKAVATMTDADAKQKIAEAIAQNINPPAGFWGDTNFVDTLITTLEKIVGIYAVPSVQLFAIATQENGLTTEVPLSDVSVYPWHLMEIQNSLQIVVQRT
jgi:hypothetical protein